MNETPNPGSEEAIKAGCTCPIIDNHHGQGMPTKDGPVFWYTADCPVHQTPIDFELPKDL